jgi:filamentous hemagglutinin
VFLEQGNAKSGLQHIVDRHAGDFARRGIPGEQIPDAVMAAVTRGKVVGQLGSGKNTRSVFEVEFQGKTQRVAVGVSDNGYVVTAHPAD